MNLVNSGLPMVGFAAYELRLVKDCLSLQDQEELDKIVESRQSWEICN